MDLFVIGIVYLLSALVIIYLIVVTSDKEV